MDDGLLLKPSWAATPVDAYFSFRAGLGSQKGDAPSGPDGELYTSHTALSLRPHGLPYTVTHVLAIDLKANYSVPLVTLPRGGTHTGTPTGMLTGMPAGAHFTWAANTGSCADSLPADVQVQQADSLHAAASRQV